mmetsp:Transcript_38793/g.115351  ORF Transcript_38793/g.115351 Transcript_38793/m.115351 type:complete len:244 (-) Transcript_38793:724-1455(-)
MERRRPRHAAQPELPGVKHVEHVDARVKRQQRARDLQRVDRDAKVQRRKPRRALHVDVAQPVALLLRFRQRLQQSVDARRVSPHAGVVQRRARAAAVLGPCVGAISQQEADNFVSPVVGRKHEWRLLQPVGRIHEPEDHSVTVDAAARHVLCLVEALWRGMDLAEVGQRAEQAGVAIFRQQVPHRISILSKRVVREQEGLVCQAQQRAAGVARLGSVQEVFHSAVPLQIQLAGSDRFFPPLLQ